jgi:glycosyltransferase involved in cell wall biosynthesis
VFRRNYGQTAAMVAGIDHASGDVIIPLDADLQNDPADIPRLLAEIDKGFDVVSGWRKDRHDRLWSRRLPSRMANWLISRVTGVALKDYGCTLKAYRRDALVNVKLYGEMHRFIPAIASWSGASVTELPVRHHPRAFGRSKYGISRAFRVVLDLFTVKFLGSYSTKPIYAFGLPGFVLWLLGIISTITVIVQRVTPPYTRAPTNPLFVMAFFFFTLGTLFIMMGLLGELVMRTYHESQGKPIYVVRQVITGRFQGDRELRSSDIGRLRGIQAAESPR